MVNLVPLRRKKTWRPAKKQRGLGKIGAQIWPWEPVYRRENVGVAEDMWGQAPWKSCCLHYCTTVSISRRNAKKNMETQKLAKELDRQSSVSIAGMTVAAIDSIVKYVKWSKNIKEKIVYYLGTTMTKLTAAYKVLSKRATTTPQNDQEREREKSPVWENRSHDYIKRIEAIEEARHKLLRANHTTWEEPRGSWVHSDESQGRNA